MADEKVEENKSGDSDEVFAKIVAGEQFSTLDPLQMPFKPEIPHDMTMFKYFVERNAKDPKTKKNVAFEAPGDDGKVKQWTYEEVHRRALQCANALKICGLNIEERILLIANNSPELAFTYLGAHAIGAVATMSISWFTTKKLWEYFTNYTRARVLVAPRSTLKILAEFIDEKKGLKPRYLRRVLVTNNEGKPLPSNFFVDWDVLVNMQQPNYELPPDLCADDSALWYFTSGTTGLPKGCVHLQHDMIYATKTYAEKTMELVPNDKILCTSPMVGPYGMGSNLLFPFGVGATAILDCEQPMDAKKCCELVEKYQPTIVITTPGVIRALCSEPSLLKYTAAWQKSVRYLTSAGDVLPAAIYNKFKKTFKVEILDGIGTSELQHIFISNHLGKVRPGSVGTLVPGYRAAIVDDDGKFCDVGEPGELLVYADSNSISYWNKHEKSKGVFYGDWYRTGDMAYVDKDGYYYLCGRKKDLKSMFSDAKRNIKISFLRIEDCLLEHDKVLDCAVVDMTDDKGQVKTSAYIVMTPEDLDALEELMSMRASTKQDAKELLEPPSGGGEFSPEFDETNRAARLGSTVGKFKDIVNSQGYIKGETERNKQALECLQIARAPMLREISRHLEVPKSKKAGLIEVLEAHIVEKFGKDAGAVPNQWFFTITIPRNARDKILRTRLRLYSFANYCSENHDDPRGLTEDEFKTLLAVITRYDKRKFDASKLFKEMQQDGVVYYEKCQKIIPNVSLESYKELLAEESTSKLIDG